MSCSAGGDHSAFIKVDGTLWTMGRNFSGQLGQGDTTDRANYTQIGTDTDWVMVACGSNFTFALKADGTLWSCGNNLSGDLALGDTTDRLSLVQVGTDTDWSFVSCCGGGGPFDGVDFIGHTLAIKTGGTLWSAGANFSGQLGLGDTTNRNSFVQIGSGTTWVHCSAGHRHSNAIKSDGTLWTCGNKLAGGTFAGGNWLSLVQAGTDTDWEFVSSGNDFSLAIKTDGTLWGAGFNSTNQLGMGSGSPFAVAPYAQSGSATNWVEVSAGNAHSIAINSSGELYSTGDNTYGQLGLGDTTQRAVFTLSATSVSSCSATGDASHSLYVTTGDSLWGAGDNTYGDLGDGTTTQRNSFVNIV